MEAPTKLPPQHRDDRPGREAPMHPEPAERAEWYRGSGKLDGKMALRSGPR